MHPFFQKIFFNSDGIDKDQVRENFILLSSHQKSVKFTDFIERISNSGKSLNGEPESFKESYELDSNQFINSVEKTYF